MPELDKRNLEQKFQEIDEKRAQISSLIGSLENVIEPILRPGETGTAPAEKGQNVVKQRPSPLMSSLEELKSELSQLGERIHTLVERVDI